eukprot:CAMPEP_0203751054 /NCGR_PEP_ID=MMETSP0098-20131031/5186_1 /ASSEMBLY_ACC=CAM_ASM_000208 /TAXON_ID=96639 /ORGANISM=" , Strain NY0313808BC1" /LENGTH=283 /DNA_ID=CAMNT_0050640607 /DNA_START=115 /DNA_END=966 /DNA_ORIENTATION=+
MEGAYGNTPLAQKIVRDGADENTALIEAQPFFPGFELEPIAVAVNSENVTIEGGEFSQLLKIKLQPGEMVSCEPGTMVVMTQDLGRHVDIGSCGQGCKRCCCAGESLYRLNFSNHSSQVQYLCLAPDGPGRIIPIDLKEYSGITFRRGAFLAAYGQDWTVNLRMASGVATGCCGGQGLFLNELHGSGLAFIVGTGSIERVSLRAGEVYLAAPECVVAFTKTVHYSVESNGCMLCCCGGMGLYNAKLTGPGTIFLQSLPMERLRRKIGAGGGGGGNNNNNNNGS